MLFSSFRLEISSKLSRGRKKKSFFSLRMLTLSDVHLVYFDSKNLTPIAIDPVIGTQPEQDDFKLITSLLITRVIKKKRNLQRSPI